VKETHHKLGTNSKEEEEKESRCHAKSFIGMETVRGRVLIWVGRESRPWTSGLSLEVKGIPREPTSCFERFAVSEDYEVTVVS